MVKTLPPPCAWLAAAYSWLPTCLIFRNSSAPPAACPALKAAVDNGADAVYVGFKNATNARNFAGLNFSDAQLVEGIRYAQSRGREVLIAINTFPQPGQVAQWRACVDRAADLGANAVIMADMGLLAYAHQTHPQLKLRSVRAGLGDELRGD